MAKYRITGPDGSTYEINAPEGASEQQVLDFAKQHFGGGGKPAEPAVSAPPGGLAMGLRDPIDAGAQLLRRAVPEPVAQAVDTFGNWLASKGLPVAPSSGEQGVDAIVKDVNRQYEQQRRAGEGGADPGFDWARLGGNMLNPANYLGGGAVAGASTLKGLALAGAKAGAVSGALQPVVGEGDFWAQKGGQALAGAAGGAVLTPAAARAGEAVAKGVQSMVRSAARTTEAHPEVVRVQVTNILGSQGMDARTAPREIRDSVQRQVNEALSAGAKLDPAAIVRRAQFEAVGLTGDAAPTLGQMTRDPMQWANEKNLSGVRIQTPRGEGNPLADRLQLQNQRLGEVFDLAGAKEATDRVTAGQALVDALKAYDAPVKAGVDGLYQNARSMTGGRVADLERGAFTRAANEALDRGMWGRFVPPEIRGLLNDITEGKVPFNVESSVQIDGILSSAQRKAQRAGDDAGAAAIGVIRSALHDTPLARMAPAAAAAPAAAGAADDAARAAANVVDNGVDDVAFREIRPAGLPLERPALPGPQSRAVAPDFEFRMPPPGGEGGFALGPVRPPAVNEGELAREAFDQARRAARNRFATIEDTPALKAALDDVAPDKFVQQFVLGANVRDVQAMKRVLAGNPQAWAQARAQVAHALKEAAFGKNVSGDKAFTAERYMRTLDAIGPEKLKLFFEPSELVRMNLAGKVASDINSIPAGAKYGTNSSGTGAALMNLLSKISEAPLLRQLPGARAIANQVGEIRTEQAISRALSPQPAAPAPELSPEAMRALQRLFPATGVAGGILGGASLD